MLANPSISLELNLSHGQLPAQKCLSPKALSPPTPTPMRFRILGERARVWECACGYGYTTVQELVSVDDGEAAELVTREDCV